MHDGYALCERKRETTRGILNATTMHCSLRFFLTPTPVRKEITSPLSRIIQPFHSTTVGPWLVSLLRPGTSRLATGLRLECMAGDWVIWLVGFMSES
jgi:hypothetical protein